jgi:hypothetical protein
MKINRACYRIYSDFLMPSRLNGYKIILEIALDKKYEMHSIISFWNLIKNNKIDPHKKYFISRHDIDTDISTARKIWETEKELGIISTFYFRLSTIDKNLMFEIDNYGSEASYHYEEIAHYCKQRTIKSQEEVLQHITTIRKEFKNNYLTLKKEIGRPMRTIASHGDFVN